jgi:hypothetical protein
MPIQVDQTSQALFKASVKHVLGDEKSILFWYDPWLAGGSILDMMPELGAVVPREQTPSHRDCCFSFAPEQLDSGHSGVVNCDSTYAVSLP